MIRSKSRDLAPEQIGDGKSDQRQFIDRRAVGGFFRRPQNGEMDEIDIGVGFQKIAPHPLALMRLARHQQHAQFVAHALDRDDGAVVDLRQFVGQRRDFEFEDIRPGVLDRALDVDRLADRRVERRDPLAVAAHFNARRARRNWRCRARAR